MLRVTVLFLLLSPFGFAQKGEEAKTDIHIPNQICLDNDIPFVRMNNSDELESFEFMMYDRWGELVAESDDYKFELGKILKVNEGNLLEMQNYFIIIRFKQNGEDEQLIKRDVTYIGYCNEG